MNEKLGKKEERTDWLHDVEQWIKEQIAKLQQELDEEDQLI